MSATASLGLQALRSTLATELSLRPERLPAHAVRKAAVDALYLHHLVASKGEPVLLELLFAEARTRPSPERPGRLRDQAGQVAKALVRSRLRFVGETERQQRLAACMACAHRQAPADGGLRRILRTRHVCGLCGCDVEKKARLAGEACPATPARW